MYQIYKKFYTVILIFLVFGISGVGCGINKQKNVYLDDKFRIGQVWEYNTRKGEEKSLIKILKLEKDKRFGVIVHISIDNVDIQGIDGKKYNEIGHLPSNVNTIVSCTRFCTGIFIFLLTC